MPVCVACEHEVSDGARFCPYCGANIQVVAAAAGDPYVGKLVAGKYLVEQLLGEGGMGKVYKAIQQPLDKAVVLKVLRQSLHGDASLVARFQREARAASRLSHPNSISVTDFGQMEDGALYIAMEYLDGRDLGVLLAEEGPLAEARLLHVMAQVVSALADAHAANIIHRDLKPENIMVVPRRDDPDSVKVLDFGIAKIQDPRESPDAVALTQTGLVCGTPEYMSPEQARGENLDARSDIYACGVILYQLATGQLPFVAETSVGIVTKHLTEPPPSPRVLRPDVSVDLEALILRCMSKDPAQRPASAEALLEELKAIGTGPRPQPVSGGTQLFGAVGPAAGGAAGPGGASPAPSAAAPGGLSASPGAAVPVAGAGSPAAPAEAGMGAAGPGSAPASLSAPAEPLSAPSASGWEAGEDDLAPPPRRGPVLVAGIAVVALAAVGGYLLASGTLFGAAGDDPPPVATAGQGDGAGAAATNGEAGGAAATPGDAAADAQVGDGPAETGGARAAADTKAADGQDSGTKDADGEGSGAKDADAARTTGAGQTDGEVAKAGSGAAAAPKSRRDAKAGARRTAAKDARTVVADRGRGGRKAAAKDRARAGDAQKARAYTAKADARWAEGDFEQALRLYLSALRADPGDAVLHRKIGLAYLSLGKRDKAVWHLKKYLRMSPKAADAPQIRSIIAGG